MGEKTNELAEKQSKVSEIEELTIDQLREQLAKLDRAFSEKEQGENGVPTAREIEDMWGQLLANTKDIYAHHISERLNNVDERPMIARKKESMPKRG